MRNSGKVVPCMLCRYKKHCTQLEGVPGRGVCAYCLADTPRLRAWLAGRLYRPLKAACAKKGRPFTLTLRGFTRYLNKPCRYCGLPIFGVKLDRVDNRKGYVPGNVASCCSECNWAKGQRTAKRYVQHCCEVAAHAKKNARK